MREKEPRTVIIRYPGEGFWEQVEKDGEHTYAFYQPPRDNIFGKKLEKPQPELIEFSPFNVKPTDDETTIHYHPLKRCPWPLPGEPIKPSEELWTEVLGYTFRHVDLPDERLYDVVTAWIFATWIREAWQAVPYLHLIGPKKSGKTRLLEVLQNLCYRGILSANISEAALFRSVEIFKPTLLLDEAEIYGKENRDSIQNLLNAGYRRGQFVIRVGGIKDGNPVLDLFEVFGFKALAGTGGFKARARINMEKNVRPVENFLDKEKAKELRSQLLYWRFRRLSEVSEVSEVSPEVIGDSLSFADGRFLELYTPLLTVCNHGRDRIVSYARESYDIMLDEEQTTPEAQILQAIVKCKPELDSGKFSTSLLTEKFNEDRSEKEQWGTRSVGRVVKRLGLHPKRMSGGKAGWVYNEARIQRLAARYGVTLGETSQTSLTSLEDQKQADFMDRRDDYFERLAEEDSQP